MVRILTSENMYFCLKSRGYVFEEMPPAAFELYDLLGGHPGGTPVILLDNVIYIYKYITNDMSVRDNWHLA